MRKAFILITGLTLTSIAYGQLDTIPRDELLEDFRIFKESISEIHGGLYWYRDSLEIEAGFRKIEEALNRPMHIGEFYSQLQPFYASLGCGHSWMSIPRQWRDYLDEHSFRFPFYLYFEKNRIVLLNDLTENGNLKEGSTVSRINGQPALEVFRQLWKYAPSDGKNQTRRAQIVKWNFDKYYQTFIRLDSTIELSLVDQKTDKEEHFILSCATAEVLEQRYSERYEAIDEPWVPVSFSIQEGVGYMDINTFGKYSRKTFRPKYKKFLKKSFQALEEGEINKMILDLRGNDGGKDRYGAWLTRYLINEEFRYFDKMEARTRKFRFHENSTSRGLNLVGLLFKTDEKKEVYRWTHHAPLKTQKPRKHAFDGTLVVLTDGSSFSTTSDVAAILHYNTDAFFIGEETGGGYYGNTSAISYPIKLQHANLWFYIPVIRYYNAVDNPSLVGRGVPPNMELQITYDDYLEGLDSPKEAAFDYLRKL